MRVFEHLESQLQQLTQVVAGVPAATYTSPVPALNRASIGDHTRHIVEILQCVILGYEVGLVDYHHRLRDLALARDPQKALSRIGELLQGCRRSNKAVNVIYSASFLPEDQLLSTYYRELQYNVEHAIHHMALMKVAFHQLNVNEVPEDFGVAYATLEYRKNTAG